MKTSRLHFVLLFALVFITASSTFAQKSYKAKGVSISYPSDWSVTEKEDQVTFTSPDGKGIYMILIQPNTEGSSAMDFIAAFERNMEATSMFEESEKTLGTKKCTAANAKSGAFTAFEKEIDGVMINYQTLCYLNNSKFYILMNVCPSDELDTWMPQFDVLTNSFKIKS